MIKNVFLIDTYWIYSEIKLNKIKEFIVTKMNNIEETCCKFTCCADGCCSDGCETGKCSSGCCKDGCCSDSENCCS